MQCAKGAHGSGHCYRCRTSRLKSAEGAIKYSAPQLANGAEPCRSRISAAWRRQIAELEVLAVEIYVRRPPRWDIETSSADRTGAPLRMSTRS